MNYINNFFSSLLENIANIIPGISGSILVIILGFIAAYLLKKLVLLIFKRTKLDEKINSRFTSGFKLDHFIASVVYYLVLMYVLILVLGMMGVQGVLDPLTNMMNEFLGHLPNLVVAIVIVAIGYAIAKLVSEALGFVADSAQVFSSKNGFNGDNKIGKFVRQLIFIIVFFPILITALDALHMDVITDPAKEMFSEFLSAVPDIVGALLLLAVFYFIGRYLTRMLADLLKNLGMDGLSESLGLGFINAKSSLSNVIANIIFFFVMFGGVIAASDKLGLPQVSELLDNIFDMSGKIFLGLGILFVGNYISHMAKKSLENSNVSGWTANFARIAILVLFVALGINTMGIAPELVNIAFGLTLGAVAIALAVAFGIGGRKAAESYLDKFIKEREEKKD